MTADEEIKKVVPPELWPYLEERDGAARLAPILRRDFDPVVREQIWDYCGLNFQLRGRPYEALSIYYAFYEEMLRLQQEGGTRVHKGTPLVRISDLHASLKHPVLAKRYVMLTACEDAIRDKGRIPAETTGTYFRMVWQFGIPHEELARYADEIGILCTSHPDDAVFPEWVLQELDQRWMTDYPSDTEASMYVVNTRYIRWLLSRLGEGDGLALERLGHYLLSCVPGFRAYMRTRSQSTDYDAVCAPEGMPLDFRAELGRYFLCECKDWGKPVDVGAFSKFASILQSAKCHFGIIFSRSGITGEGKTKNAEREQLKFFQNQGLVIIVISESDLEWVAEGGNFLALLRSKYEQVRLDLPKPHGSVQSRLSETARA